MLAGASFVPDAFRELQKWSETQVWQTHSCASTSAAAGRTQRREAALQNRHQQTCCFGHLAQGREQCSLSPLIDLFKPSCNEPWCLKQTMLSHSDTFSSENEECVAEFDTRRLFSFASLWCIDTNMMHRYKHGIQMSYMCKSLKPQSSCIRNGDHH